MLEPTGDQCPVARCSNRRGGPLPAPHALASEISHVIRLLDNSTTATNVAIPTSRFQCLKDMRGNYVRDCWETVTLTSFSRSQSRGTACEIVRKPRHNDRRHRSPPTHSEAATGKPATASSMNERQREISATSTRAVTAATQNDRNVASDGANLVAVDLVLNLERRRLQACFNLELHAFSSSYSHRFGTRSCFSTSQFLSVSIRESARPMPIATIVNMTVKSAASASSVCWLFR